MVREILLPATKDNSKVMESDLEDATIEEPLDSDIELWSSLLSVRDPGSGKTHLLDPSVFESASVVSV